MSKNKKSILIVILGLILIGIGFLIHLTNRYRLLLIILGFIIQIFGMTIYHKKKIIIIPILILIFGSSLIYIDYYLLLNLIDYLYFLLGKKFLRILKYIMEFFIVFGNVI